MSPTGRRHYPAQVRARDLAVQVPTVTPAESVWDAARIVASGPWASVVVVDAGQRLLAVLPGSQLVGLALPEYVRDDAALASVVDESFVDTMAPRLAAVTVAQALSDARHDPHPRVAVDATVTQIAETMADEETGVVVVVDDDQRVVGVVTAAAVLRFLGA